MTLRFTDCTLDVEGHELRRDGERVAIEPQVFDVLAHLAEHRDRVVLKTELLDEIWGDRFVSESALTSRIKSARRAVGDSGREQRIIRTIHGRGFRFVAEVDGDRREDATPAVRVGRESPGGGDIGSDLTADLAKTVLNRLAEGRGTAVATTGPSRTLGQVMDDIYETAAGAGYLVGRGSGSGAELRPFGCVIDAIDELAQRSPQLLDLVPTSCRVELERVLGGHQPSIRSRLFLGVRELLVAATDHQATLLLLDQLQYADADTIALLDHCARLTRQRRLVVVAAHGPGTELAGLYERVELSGSALDQDEADDTRRGLPPELADLLRMLALEGSSFDTALVRAAAGDADSADRLLDQAISGALVEAVPSGSGYRFTSMALADDLVAELAPHRRAQLHLDLAERLGATDAEPGRVARHLLAGEAPASAVPYVLAATREADRAQSHAEVLRWTDAVLDHASEVDRLELLTLRATALAAMGDPTATQVFRDALVLATPGGATDLLTGLARAAALAGDLETATEALGSIGEADAEQPPVLLVRAMVAYFRGDLDAADELLDAARSGALAPSAPDQLLGVITMQGLIAHDRGEWFDRLRLELRTTRDTPDLAVTIFDSHLCVAEYLLYGSMPYDEVIELSADLRRNAEQTGARRAVAFAACVTGEARLLAGDLDGARTDLEESTLLHRELGADAGTARSLQRLAEVRLASGDPATATRLLREAAVLARWSPISNHLLQRIYGTLIAAAPDRETAMAAVEEANEVLDGAGSCHFCQVMVEVPATIACAEAGRLDEARRHLEQAAWSAGFWEGTAWSGAVTEAEASIALAEDRVDDATELLAQAASLFDRAGQPLDAQRCRDTIDDLGG